MLQKLNKHKLFTDQGIKSTKQRNLIYDILDKSDNPVSAEQIFTKLKDLDPSVNMSTVYRVLEVFVLKGLVLKSNIIGSNSAGYELNKIEHNHHLICLKCNKTVPLNQCPLKKLEEAIQDKTDFVITGHNLELFGYCPECNEKNK